MKPLLFLAAATLAAADAPAPAPESAPAAPAEPVLQVPEPGRFKALFEPFRSTAAALSPDGRLLAYTIREKGVVSVAILEVDQPGKMKARVAVVDDEAATAMLALGQREPTPGRVTWLRWVSPTRLVVQTNRIAPSASWKSVKGAILAFDADGGNARELADPAEFQELVGTDQAFSTQRGPGAGFTARTWSVDQPVALTSTADPLPGLSMPGNFANAGVPGDTAPVAVAAFADRGVNLFDLDAARPGAVTALALGAPRSNGPRSLTFYSLDATTGKAKVLNDDFIPPNEDALIDRQGRLRLTVRSSLLAQFPFVYQYFGPKGRSRGQPLDRVGGAAGFTVSPDNFFGERSIPLGFAADPNLLYFASNVGRDTYGIYSLDLAAGKRGPLAMENPRFDLIASPGAGFPDAGALVFDRFTHQLAGVRYEGAFATTAWTTPLLREVQAQLEQILRGHGVEILDWDEAGNRFLVKAESPADPGAYYLFDRARAQLSEFARRAPWIDAHHVHATLPFSYATAGGARITGLVTAPRQPRLQPVPMVVICPDLPWQRVDSGFQTEVHALAEMGFVVVQLNGRGAWGLGRRQRESLTAGYDQVQVEDLVTTLDELGKVFAVNPRRVALLGRGHGGFIALRALQEHPDRFRGAIAIDPPVNLADWLAEQKWTSDDVLPHLTRHWLGDEARLRAAPLASAPGKVTRPVLLFSYPGLDGAPRRSGYVAARRFAEAVQARGGQVEFADLRPDYAAGLPAARAEVFDRIEAFLNLNLYDFQVKVPDFKVIK